ncbi:hypothetical protein OUZ56_012842 [Daphnia magna]|uniref:Uncharacterized protein n=1 Tax=Daphnia magna TaxID=35525 RepID=A0ABQ9Z510_9CRUS|nr:hypothetical protein OUZ56_012842 [Daphnia magna]
MSCQYLIVIFTTRVEVSMLSLCERSAMLTPVAHYFPRISSAPSALAEKLDRELIGLNAQEKTRKEKAEKRKKNNKGYGCQERKTYTRKESATILAKPSSSRCKTSNFGVRFPVEGSRPSVILHNEEAQWNVNLWITKLKFQKNFPVEFTKEFIDNQVECINFLKFTEKEFPDERGKSKTKEKKIVEDDIESGWDVTMVETAYKAVVEVYGCKWSDCHPFLYHCFQQAPAMNVQRLEFLVW